MSLLMKDYSNVSTVYYKPELHYSDVLMQQAEIM